VLANAVLETVNRISAALGLAVLLIEHNVPRALKVVQRAIILKGGRVLSDGAAEDLLEKQDLWDWF
jgi:branched-chain amino acid transport system ATP-binding protein